MLNEVPRHIGRELDHKALRDLQKRALHFQLDVRRPATVRKSGTGGPGRRASLADTLRDSLRARPLTAGVDREALVSLGLRYLEIAEVSEPARELPGVEA